jgi:glycosyltransferase involved in cell wall biosynthesis
LVYVGALGGWYLTDEMAEFLAVAHQRDPSTFALILTQSAAEPLIERFRVHGLPERAYLIQRVAPEEIPRYLKAADLALSFIKPCYSKVSSSPTKLAEYLASGIPVVCSAGIGDVDEVISGDRVGVIVREFTRAAYLEALVAVEALREEQGIEERCRGCARDRFDLQTVGGIRYRRLYRRLLERTSASVVTAS